LSVATKFCLIPLFEITKINLMSEKIPIVLSAVLLSIVVLSAIPGINVISFADADSKIVVKASKQLQKNPFAMKILAEMEEQKLRKGGISIKKDAVIVVQNIVAAINLGGKIHLEQAARTLPRSMYEPEQFPGLIHRMVDPKTVILLFASGKLVCTGAKKEADVYRSVHNLHALLEEKKLMIYDE